MEGEYLFLMINSKDKGKRGSFVSGPSLELQMIPGADDGTLGLGKSRT
jgi:hypothetical protein